MSDEIIKLAARLIRESNEASVVTLQPCEIALALSALRAGPNKTDVGASGRRSEACEIMVKDAGGQSEQVLAVICDEAAALATFKDVTSQNPGRNIRLAKARRSDRAHAPPAHSLDEGA